MADIKITLNPNTTNSLQRNLAYAGEFSRAYPEAKIVRTKTDLRKFFGNNFNNDGEQVEKLLDKNIPLVIKAVERSTDEVSTLSMGDAPFTETITGVYDQYVPFPITALTLNDGVNNAATSDFGTLTNSFDLYDSSTIDYRGHYSGNILYVRFNAGQAPSQLQVGDLMRFSAVGGVFAGIDGEDFTISNVFFSNNRITVALTPVDTNLVIANEVIATIDTPYYTDTSGVVDLRNGTNLVITLTNNPPSIDSILVGDTIYLTNTDVAANNNKPLTVIGTNDAGGILTLTCQSQFVFTDDPNLTANGEVNYLDQTVKNTLTVNTDFTDIINTVLNTGLILNQGGNNTNLTVDSVVVNGNDTIFTVVQTFSNLVVGESLLIPFNSSGNSVFTMTDNPAPPILINNIYGFYETSPTNVVDRLVITELLVGKVADTAYFEVDGNLPQNISNIANSSTSGGILITTKSKGNHSDLRVTIVKKTNSVEIKVEQVNPISNELVESWLLYDNYTDEDLEAMNTALETISIEVNNFSFPIFYSQTFPNTVIQPATQTEVNESIEYFDNLPVPAIFGKLTVPIGNYDYKFPKTIFIAAPSDYNITQVNALAASYNTSEGRNVLLTYGDFNGEPIVYQAIRAFYDRLGTGLAITQEPYDDLGLINLGKINTVLKEQQVKDFDTVGVTTLFSLNGSFSRYKLMNNTTPYRSTPLERANVNFILNQMIWEVHNIEFVNKDKPLNIALFGAINAQFRQLLSNYSQFLSVANILDDANAANLDDLVYNNKADVLAGTYKVILELVFFNTLKKLSVEFIIS